MLTFLLLLLLLIGFYTGMRRGLMLQLIHTFGYLCAYLVAKTYYKSLAPYLSLYIPYPSPTENTKLVFFNQELSFELDQAFYAGISFLLILAMGWLVVRFLCIFAHKLTFIPLIKQANGLAGGILNLVVMYIGIFLCLRILSMVPLTSIQNQFEHNGLARFIVQNTPVFSKQIYSMWIEQMVK